MNTKRFVFFWLILKDLDWPVAIWGKNSYPAVQPWWRQRASLPNPSPSWTAPAVADEDSPPALLNIELQHRSKTFRDSLRLLKSDTDNLADKCIPSLGTMFLTMKASQAPGVKTSLQGCRISLAEESLGCQRCKAWASLLRMGAYSGSRRVCIRGSQGWIQEWIGTVSVSGFQLSTYPKTERRVKSHMDIHSFVKHKIYTVHWTYVQHKPLSVVVGI